MALTERARQLRNAYQRELYRKRSAKQNRERQEAYWNKKAAEQEALEAKEGLDHDNKES